MKKKIRNVKLESALELLSDAAKEKKREIQNLLQGKYGNFQKILKVNGRRVVRQAKKGVLKVEKRVIERAKEFDDKVHENPWPYLGAVAFSSIVLGMMVGHKNHNKIKQAA